MLKASKKVIAMLIAVLFIVAMVPVAVNAATQDVSFNVNCAKDGYEFEVYQLATLDVETGLFTKNANTSDTIYSLITNKEKSTADVLSACDSATEKYGTKTGDTYVSNTGVKQYSVTSGIYYIRATKQPATVKSVQNSIVALPYYSNNRWNTTLPDVEGKVSDNTINLAAKVNEGTADAGKIITNSTTGSNTYSTAGVGDEVKFRLNATVVGSSEKVLKNYAIIDNMSSGLTFKQIDKVYLKAVTGGTDKVLTTSDYEFKTNYKYTPAGGTEKTADFAIVLNQDTVLKDSSFYSYADVVVEYTAVLNENAVKGSAGNPNEDGLVYTNANDVVSEVAGDTVTVYTFGLKVEKVDSADDKKKLQGAEFAVYKSDDTSKTILATAVTGTDGIGVFKDAQGNEYNFKDGNYVVYETKAPTGFNLNTHEYTVSINPEFEGGILKTPADGFVSTTIENTASKLPETGGMGTMLFTITGASLIACAGILFIVLKRKKSSK